MRNKAALLILVLASVVALGQAPALPNFVDNNELICQITAQCVAGSPALASTALPGGTVGPYTVPTYEYLLGTSTVGLPATCSFAASYATTAAGWQSARNAIEACRTQHALCGILDIPPGQYPTSASLLVPQTNTTTTHASCPIIERTASWANLEAMPEPVGAGGIQDNVQCLSLPCQIGLRNPSLDGVNANSLSVECPPTPGLGGVLAYQLGTGGTSPRVGTFCIPPGSFTLADGTVHNTTDYNYLQYMPQLVATGIVAPTIFCSVAPGASAAQTCNNPSTLPHFGPDLWYFEGIIFSPSVGNVNNMDLVKIQDNGGNSTSVTQWASHIHFRRIALLGDWTNLTAGSNQIATGMSLGQCFYCSLVGSSATQLLRPGGEGHVISYNGTYAKLSNNWLEGQSSCIFSGGSGSAPSITPIGSFISAQDVEQRRTRCTFPVAWLGSPYGPGQIPDTNPYWGGAGDNPAQPTRVNVATDGVTVTYVSGPQFHDSTSFWPGNNVTINGSKDCFSPNKTNCKLVNAGSWPQTCGTFCYPSNPPTQLLLVNPVCNPTPCLGLTNIPFILNGASIVRKNCDEKKSGVRYLFAGDIFENVDGSGGQRGICLVLSTRNTSGGGQGTNYQDAELDYNIQNSIFQNTCEGNTLGANSASSAGNGGGVGGAAQRLSYYNDASLNMTHSNPGCPSGSSVGFQINVPFQTWTGTVTGNGTTATFVAAASVDEGVPLVSDTATYNSVTGCTGSGPCALTINVSTASTDFITGETVHFTCAGCAGDSGVTELQNSDFPVASLTPTTLTLTLLAGSTDPVSLAVGTKVQGPAGFQVFNIATGFPVFLSGCANAAFNTATGAIGPIASSGSAAWTGAWTAANTTVSYPSAVSGSTTCTIANVQGRPNNFYFQKQLMITDAPSALGTGNAPTSGGAPYALNGAVQDVVLLNSGAAAGSAGWFNSAALLGEGNVTETFQFDKTTLTASTLLIPRPFGAAALYTEYCNNSTVPCAGTIPRLHFPCSNGSVCTTGGIYASCTVGFINTCTGLIPLNLPDYHSYGLAITSPFFTAASDGGPLDVDFAAIDAAETANTYVPMVMGIPVVVAVGPFPDTLVGTPPPPAPTAPAAKAFAGLLNSMFPKPKPEVIRYYLQRTVTNDAGGTN